mgnify:CR=1 FL=1
MTVATRRAPWGHRLFAVLRDFRYNQREYEAGGVFDATRGVPRMRVDKLWREGLIGTLDGQSCPTAPQEDTSADSEATDHSEA